MKVEINGVEWNIEEATPTTNTRLYVDGSPRFGICELGCKNILIDKNLRPDVKIQVLRHELTHAFLNAFLLDRKESYTEEELAEFVALYGQQVCDYANQYMKDYLRRKE